MNVVFVHGWSARPRSMANVARALEEDGLDFEPYFFQYRSRDDEGTIADFAEGLHEDLKRHGLLVPAAESVPASTRIPRTLNFVTHSTGALVVRRWLQQYAWARAADRVATVCFLAPANFGSPLAHKGRSLLGRIGKGIRELKDFSETGKRTLEALELASPEQWSLADYDLFGKKGSVYGESGVRATVVTGASGYGGLSSFVNEDGTDGTIVVSGAGLSCRKYSIDFVSENTDAGWIKQPPSKLPSVPCLILAEPDHGKILKLTEDQERKWESQEARRQTLRAVRATLESTATSYGTLRESFVEQSRAQKPARPKDEIYQQFIFRLRDDRGDSIPDYTIDFGAWHRDRIVTTGPYPRPEPGSRQRRAERRVSERVGRHFRENGHAHSVDSSYRRFLVSPARINELLTEDGEPRYVVTLSVTAHSGDDQIHYATKKFENLAIYDPKKPGRISWVFPDTTTLIEMRIDRYTQLTKLFTEVP